MDILFDENGYLKPYEPIKMDLDLFESTFVFNNHRRERFEEYIEFINLLKELPVGNFSQWVNGSYTTRFAYPKDIDFVSFVDSNFYRKFESKLNLLSKEFKYKYLDAYFEPVFPESHFMNAVTRYNTADWKFLYQRDRKFRKKGFVELNF